MTPSPTGVARIAHEILGHVQAQLLLIKGIRHVARVRIIARVTRDGSGYLGVDDVLQIKLWTQSANPSEAVVQVLDREDCPGVFTAVFDGLYGSHFSADGPHRQYDDGALQSFLAATWTEHSTDIGTATWDITNPVRKDGPA